MMGLGEGLGEGEGEGEGEGTTGDICGLGLGVITGEGLGESGKGDGAKGEPLGLVVIGDGTTDGGAGGD